MSGALLAAGIWVALAIYFGLSQYKPASSGQTPSN